MANQNCPPTHVLLLSTVFCVSGVNSVYFKRFMTNIGYRCAEPRQIFFYFLQGEQNPPLSALVSTSLTKLVHDLFPRPRVFIG